MGLLTALRLRRSVVYRVRYLTADGWHEWCFPRLRDARSFADSIALREGVICVVQAMVRDEPRDVAYTAVPPDDDGPGEGTSGVREPRRPRPGSSAGSVALDLPE
jgi:hypothetical protein